MIKAKLIVTILVIFLTGDLIYSFFEYYYIPLDGDISYGVVPGRNVQQLLDDPLGFHLLSTGEKHINPNRYFAHVFFKEYMQKMPLILQNFTSPIVSVYLSCALIKMLVHFLALFALSILISGTTKVLNKTFLLSAVLITPLIQANGYWDHMGINDRATTYTFFYALPTVLLMIYMMPLIKLIKQEEIPKFGFIKSILWLCMAIALPLSGPLVPGIVLISTVLIGIYFLFYSAPIEKKVSIKILLNRLQKMPTQIFIFIIPISLISLYSLFLGLFDSNYGSEVIPIVARYQKLPLGIYYQISQSLGVPILLILIGVNIYLIKRTHNLPESQKLITEIKWIGLFTAIYLFLLPLGGYRPYRPNILRYDTFIPITIALLYFYGHSTLYLLQNIKRGSKNIYITALVLIFAIYMNSDKIETQEYKNERKAIEFLVNSPAKVTLLPPQNSIMSWQPINIPEQSEMNAKILKFWGITKEEKLYYQTSNQ